jgi:general secretion pathway protein D
MKNLHKIILIMVCVMCALVPVSIHADSENIEVEKIEFFEAPLNKVAKILTDLSGDNIITTPAAGEIEITIFLINMSIHDAIESICRVHDLWYRKDSEKDIYRIMTNEEYSKDLVIHKDEMTRFYTVRAPNVETIGETIENIYGGRVILEHAGEETDINDTLRGASSGGNNGSSNSNSFNNNSDQNSTSNNNFNSSGSNNSGSSGGGLNRQRSLDEDLTSDQIADLGIARGSNIISGQDLLELADIQYPIYVSLLMDQNMIVVRSSDHDALNSIDELVAELDKPIPQVLLEMKVIDVLLGDDFESLFEMDITGINTSSPIVNNATGNFDLGSGGTSLGGGLMFSFVSNLINANLEYLHEKNRVTVLSTPMVMAANNRPARLFVGEQIPTVSGYSTESPTSTDTTGTNIIQQEFLVPTITLQDVGSTIFVTPFINDDDTVTIMINQENSTVKSGGASVAVVADTNLLTLPIDTIVESSISGTVIGKNGLTFAIGGLVRESISDIDNNVPLLSSLPAIGDFFTSRKNGAETSELILLITPHIMENYDEQDSYEHRNKDIEINLEHELYRCRQHCL